MVFYKVDVLDGAKCLLRILQIIAFNVSHLDQRNAGIGRVGIQFPQIPAVDQDLIPAHQLRIGGHAGKAAKKAFDELGVRKLPTVKDLQVEFADQLTAKKEAYAELKKVRDVAVHMANYRSLH